MVAEVFTLTDSAGGSVRNPSEAQIVATIERVGSGIDFCTLDLGASRFVQAAGSPGCLFVEYRDTSGMYRSSVALDGASVRRIFVDTRRGVTEWKSVYPFEVADPPRGTSDRPLGSERRRVFGSATGSIKAGVHRALRREARYGMSRLVRRWLQRFFGRRF